MSHLYTASSTDDGWMITDYDAPSIFHVSVRDITQHAAEHDFHGLDRGTDDLRVIHLTLWRDVGFFEFLNRLVAQRFDLPTRTVTAEMREGFQHILGENFEPVDAGDEVLHTVFRGHFILPRSEWLLAKEAYAQRISARESERAVNGGVAG